MKVLVTGAAGFIGSNLCQRLIAEKVQVTGLDNLSYGLRSQYRRCAVFAGDIRSKIFIDILRALTRSFIWRPRTVFRLSGGPGGNSEHQCVRYGQCAGCVPQNACEKNHLRGICRLYEGVQKFPSDERMCNRFHSMGAASWRHVFMQEYSRFYGLRYTALRYFNVYGPYQDYRRTVPPVMSAFILDLLKNKRPVIYGNGRKRRDFIYVDDVNDFHLLALRDRRTDGQTYNVGSGVNYSVNEIYSAVDNILRTGIKPAFKKDLPGECRTTLADISGARRLGWKPKTDLMTGLTITVEHIRNNVL